MRSPTATWIAAAVALPACVALVACVSPAEHEKLRRKVIDMERSGGAEGATRERLADMAAEVSRLQQENAELRGRIEVVEHRAEEALGEARAARQQLGELQAQVTVGGASAPPPAANEAEEAGVSVAELDAYRRAYAAWRDDDPGTCVDRFRNFLQTYPSSPYADDAAYWMADCYFKQGDFKTAVLRFDDVVNRYPSGNKAADALYRQGEALLRMGPGYGGAAGKAFERMLKEYPDSGRAAEAQKQLDLLKAG